MRDRAHRPHLGPTILTLALVVTGCGGGAGPAPDLAAGDRSRLDLWRGETAPPDAGPISDRGPLPDGWKPPDGMTADAKPPPKPDWMPTGASYPPLADPPRTGTAATPTGARTTFQTNGGYNAKYAVGADRVLVHMHGASSSALGSALGSWAGKGYGIERMFFSGSDGTGAYTNNNLDHPDVERRKDGTPITVGGRPYMVPSPGWSAYCDTLVKQGIDAAALAINPEEPLLHHEGGYSTRFKAAWQSFYGSAWVDPASGAQAFWQASKLKAGLYHDHIAHLAATTASQGAGKVETILPVHSALSFAATKMLFPHGRSASIPGLQGYIGQIWTYPVKALLDGEHTACSVDPAGHTDCDFFESALLLYSYFANLVRGSGKKMYFLADPVDDDPSRSWSQYEEWYKETVAAALMFPEVARFELLPWPERVYLPSSMGGAPPPQNYLRQLQAIFNAQHEMGDNLAWSSASPVAGLGILVSDSLEWQDSDTFGVKAFLGLAWPLVKAGVAVEVVPLERSVSPGFLSGYQTLVASFDGQKPLAEAELQALASWVQGGGVLLLLGNGDAYDAVSEWWKQKGHPSPVEALLSLLGVKLDLASRTVVAPPLVGNLGLKQGALTPFSGALGASLTVPRVPVTEWKLYLTSGRALAYTATGARVIYSEPGGKAVIVDQRVGKGAVVFAGISPRDLGSGSDGQKLAWELIRYAGEGWGGGPVRARGYHHLQRGRYHVVNAITAPPQLSGSFVDLFHADLPLLKNPTPALGRTRLYKKVDDWLAPGTPRLLHSNQRTSALSESANQLSVVAAGPEAASAVLRVALNGKALNGVSPSATTTVDTGSGTVLIVLPAKASGQTIQISFK